MRWRREWTIVFVPLLLGCATSRALVENSSASGIGPGPIKQVAYNAPYSLPSCVSRMELAIDAIDLVSRDQVASGSPILSPRQHDAVERALADYLFCRTELLSLSSDDAVLQRIRLDARFVTVGIENPVLASGLNQSLHRSSIEERTFDRIVLELTSSGTLTKLESLSRRSDAADVRQQVEKIVQRRAWIMPAAENQLAHFGPTRWLGKTGRLVNRELDRSRFAFVAAAGRTKNPVYHPLQFTSEQRQQLRNQLRPGDVLITYSAGYASNCFIPGNFKHAITYIGTQNERAECGITDDGLLALAGPHNGQLQRTLDQQALSTGEPADLVESLAEGVQLNNLDLVLEKRINRLVVLRPRLSPQERLAQLADVLSYVGDDYDFYFDLNDASDQVCTEVVYRSLQGRGNIDIPLSQILGQSTLTADDILRYQLQAGKDKLDCILVIDADPQIPTNAAILSGPAAQEWVAKLLPFGR